jgi:hypothetical protein
MASTPLDLESREHWDARLTPVPQHLWELGGDRPSEVVCYCFFFWTDTEHPKDIAKLDCELLPNRVAEFVASIDS